MHIRIKQLLIVGAALIIGSIIQFQEGQKEQDPVLIRGAPGEGETEQSWNLTVPGITEEEKVEFEIPERKLTEEEIEQLLEKARQEAVDLFYAGDLSHMTGSVSMAQSYQEEQVTADWEIQPDGWIDEEGQIQERHLTKEGQTLEIHLHLSLNGRVLEHIFYGTIYPKERGKVESMLWAIQNQVAEELEEKPEDEQLILPEKYKDKELIWSQEKSHAVTGFLFLGLALAVGLEFQGREQELKEQKKRKEELERDYPDFVSKIALLTGTGMTMDQVWKKVGENYRLQRQQGFVKRREVYEEVERSIRQLQEGVGEIRVYEEFGERCNLPEYRRLSSYISQNLRKGTRELEQLLIKEAENAQEKRRSMARRYGEEAGTKMLFPMLLMLGIVIAILMIPAFMKF